MYVFYILYIHRRTGISWFIVFTHACVCVHARARAFGVGERGLNHRGMRRPKINIMENV